MPKSLVTLFIVVILVETAMSCDHGVSNNNSNNTNSGRTDIEQSGSGMDTESTAEPTEDVYVRATCRADDTTITENEPAASKFRSAGGPVSLRNLGYSYIVNSNITPSLSNKWRVFLRDDAREIIMFFWGNFQNGDYIQMNKRKFNGTSGCTGFPITHTLDRGSILIGVRNETAKSTFKIKTLSPSTDTKGPKGLAQSMVNCKGVLEYIGDSDEKFQSLQDILRLVGAELQKLLNNIEEPDLHKCSILTAYKHCGGPYVGACAESATAKTRL